MIRKAVLHLFLLLIFSLGCSFNFIKKRLSAPYKIDAGILFQYEAPSARQVNLAGNFPDNEWLKHGDRVDVMNDNGINGDKIAGDGIWSIIKSLSSGSIEMNFEFSFISIFLITLINFFGDFCSNVPKDLIASTKSKDEPSKMGTSGASISIKALSIDSK